MNTISNVVSIHRMPTEQYKREREELLATYGDSTPDAGARREQELAKLFDRSGWTQRELAQAEGKSQSTINNLLCFGRFLNLITTGNQTGIPPLLTVRHFRACWEQTDKNAKEQHRFNAVVRMLQDPPSGHSQKSHKALVDKILEKFADGKPRGIDVMAKELGISRREMEVGIKSVRQRKDIHFQGSGRGSKHEVTTYRIAKKGKTIDLEVLKQRISPLLDELKELSGQHPARHYPEGCVRLVILIQRAIEELAE